VKIGAGPESRSGLDSSFRNLLPFCSGNIPIAVYTYSVSAGVCSKSYPKGSGDSLTSVDVHSGVLCSTVESFVWLHNACGGRRMVLTRELHDG